MSGPKTGIYRLTREHKEIMRVLREQQILLAEEYQRIEEYCAEIARWQTQLRRMMDDSASANDGLRGNEGLGGDQGSRSENTTMAAMVARAEQELLIYQGPAVPCALEEMRAKRERLAGFHREMGDFYRERAKEQTERMKELAAERAAAIATGMSLNFERVGREYHFRIEEALQESIDYMGADQRLLNKMESIKEKLAEDPGEDFLKTYYAVTVVPFVQECRDWRQMEELLGQEWRALRRRYRALVGESGIAPEFAKMELSPEAVAWLERENKRLGECLEWEQEQAYISQTVDEVMEEMGYRLLGSRAVVKKSGKRFHNELYHFDDETAVSVTTDERGQITMELGKMDTVDRMPAVEESHRLCLAMDEFCEDFGEIGERLGERGIMVSDLSMLPVQEQYAQIINTSEYEMNGAKRLLSDAETVWHDQENKAKAISDDRRERAKRKSAEHGGNTKKLPM
jgi:hypothetical protein